MSLDHVAAWRAVAGTRAHGRDARVWPGRARGDRDRAELGRLLLGGAA